MPRPPSRRLPARRCPGAAAPRAASACPRPAWRRWAQGARTWIWALALGLGGTGLPAAPAHAHAAESPSHDALVEALRGLGLALRNARERVVADLGTDDEDVLGRLNQALVWYFAEDHPKAALRLLDLVSRPGIAESPAYPDALAWLAQSLWAMGMETAAVRHFREALVPPAQTPTDYLRRVALWLDHDRAPPLDLLRTHQARAAVADTQAALSETADEPRLEYRFARGFYRAGALAESRARFEAVPPTDPWYLQARYFLGVIHLHDGDLVQARAAFEETLEAFEASDPAEPTPPDLLARLGPNGPDDRLLPLDPEAEDRARRAELDTADRDEAVERRHRMGTVIHLALARLAAAEERPALAWSHYRRIPYGDPDHAAALSEASFVLARREAFDWCVRVLDLLLATRGQDVSSAQLALWRNQLLARGARYTEAERGYEDLEASLRRLAEEVEARIAAENRLFPPSVLAWAAPEQGDRARRVEADLVEQTEGVLEAREIIAELEALQQSPDLLPIVAFGREQVQAIEQRLTAYDQQLEAALVHARAHARGDEDHDTHPDGPAPTEAQVAALRASAARLRARLGVFGGGLDTYERAWRARLKSVLADEKPVIAQLDTDLRAEETAARAVSTALTAVARANLDHYAAEARFGTVDLAYWRKDEITRKIRNTHNERAELEGELDEIGRELPPVEKPAPPRRARPGDAPEATPSEGDAAETDDAPDDPTEGAPGDESEASPKPVAAATPPPRPARPAPCGPTPASAMKRGLCRHPSR